MSIFKSGISGSGCGEQKSRFCICKNFMPDAAGAATAKRRFSKTEKHFGFEHFFKGV
jgi:hypothetical protein